MVAKPRERSIFKGWLGKMFIENQSNSSERNNRRSPSSPAIQHSSSSQNQWETHKQEIQSYFQHLVSLNLDEEEDCRQENENSQRSPKEPEQAYRDMVRTKNIKDI